MIYIAIELPYVLSFLPHSVPKGKVSGQALKEGLREKKISNFNYDKIFERGTTRLWVILIMGREK
jgi:hypothetical protein